MYDAMRRRDILYLLLLLFVRIFYHLYLSKKIKCATLFCLVPILVKRDTIFSYECLSIFNSSLRCCCIYDQWEVPERHCPTKKIFYKLRNEQCLYAH